MGEKSLISKFNLFMETEKMKKYLFTDLNVLDLLVLDYLRQLNQLPQQVGTILFGIIQILSVKMAMLMVQQI